MSMYDCPGCGGTLFCVCPKKSSQPLPAQASEPTIEQLKAELEKKNQELNDARLAKTQTVEELQEDFEAALDLNGISFQRADGYYTPTPVQFQWEGFYMHCEINGMLKS